VWKSSFKKADSHDKLKNFFEKYFGIGGSAKFTQTNEGIGGTKQSTTR
jgi:hypothetical protein